MTNKTAWWDIISIWHGFNSQIFLFSADEKLTEEGLSPLILDQDVLPITGKILLKRTLLIGTNYQCCKDTRNKKKKTIIPTPEHHGNC